MYCAATSIRYAGLAALIRMAFALGLVVVVVGCASPGYFSAHDTSPRRLFSVGYKNLSERYIEPLDLGELSLAGLDRLSDVDPDMRVAASGGNITLIRAGETVGEWRSPGKKDASGWADLMSQALTRARAVSDKVKAEPESKLSDRVFTGVMAKLDRYSRYADPVRARQNRAARDGFGGLGISIRVKDGATHIMKVHAGTPAAEAGLRAKDRILRVGKRLINGLSQREVVTALRGKRGTTVKLGIERDGEKDTMTIPDTRA